MAANLSLSKIVKQKSISIGEATQRIADLGWAPDYFQEILKYPTDYKITNAPNTRLSFSSCMGKYDRSTWRIGSLGILLST